MMDILRFIRNIALVLACISCASAPANQEDAALAVWDIENLTPSISVQHDMGELLSSRVIEVAQKKGHAIVERERLLLALEELHLSASSLADESTQLRLGRISGAGLMVFGGYQIIGNRMRLDLRIVEVETGRIIRAVQKLSPATGLSGWLNSAGEAAEELF